jgi:hypothetical protein
MTLKKTQVGVRSKKILQKSIERKILLQKLLFYEKTKKHIIFESHKEIFLQQIKFEIHFSWVKFLDFLFEHKIKKVQRPPLGHR